MQENQNIIANALSSNITGIFNRAEKFYSYNGRCPNLIDKFFIFGYDYLTLKKYLIDNYEEIQENLQYLGQGLGRFQLDKKPSLLVEIANNYEKKIIDTKIVKELIFPNNVYFYYKVEDNENISYKNKNSEKINKIDLSEEREGCIQSYRVTFSSNPLEGQNMKKCQNGFAYIFYRKLWEQRIIDNKKYTFYVPYTFCIISEFPFYKRFEELFRVIRKMYFQDCIYIPIEILLYKIITLTPSPINTDVILDLEKICNQKEIYKSYTKEKTNKKRTISDHKINQIKNIYNIKSGNTIDDILNLQKIYSKTLSKKQANKGDIYRNKIKFKYLSGYPLIQYNLAKVLFNTLSKGDIIKIFLFTFLESDIIFFSENIEYLTFTLNAYMNFNFPFNDAEYFYNISAISLESFKKGDNAVFTNMIGINNIFVEDYLAKNNKLNDHMIVDLDKGKILTAIEEGNDSYDKIFKLIDSICENKIKDEKVKKTKLYRAIFNLNKRLEEAYKKKDRGQNFIDFNEEPQSGSIDELNKSIQEAFYECVINLSLYCYENVLVSI